MKRIRDLYLRIRDLYYDIYFYLKYKFIYLLKVFMWKVFKIQITVYLGGWVSRRYKDRTFYGWIPEIIRWTNEGGGDLWGIEIKWLYGRWSFSVYKDGTPKGKYLQ